MLMEKRIWCVRVYSYKFNPSTATEKHLLYEKKNVMSKLLGVEYIFSEKN